VQATLPECVEQRAADEAFVSKSLAHQVLDEIIRVGHGNTRMTGTMLTPPGSRLPLRRPISSARGIKNGGF